MSDRTWENVWAEIVAKAREHMTTGEPIPTLGHGVANQIVGVSSTAIRRRSANARGAEGESVVPSSQVQVLWTALLEHGEASETGSLAFSYALVGRFIAGIEHTQAPLRLAFSDREQAME